MWREVQMYKQIPSETPESILFLEPTSTNGIFSAFEKSNHFVLILLQIPNPQNTNSHRLTISSDSKWSGSPCTFDQCRNRTKSNDRNCYLKISTLYVIKHGECRRYLSIDDLLHMWKVRCTLVYHCSSHWNTTTVHKLDLLFLIFVCVCVLPLTYFINYQKGSWRSKLPIFSWHILITYRLSHDIYWSPTVCPMTYTDHLPFVPLHILITYRSPHDSYTDHLPISSWHIYWSPTVFLTLRSPHLEQSPPKQSGALLFSLPSKANSWHFFSLNISAQQHCPSP